MDFQKKFEDYMKGWDLTDEDEIRECRKVLVKILQDLDNKSELSTKKKSKNKIPCPYCHSNNIKDYGKKPNRSYCLDCDRAYVKVRNPLHYNKRYPNKILDLIVAIYTTEKSISQIISELNISLQTYYKWKKEIIFVFPQLEEKFKTRSKSR